jgi:hypothetical protein
VSKKIFVNGGVDVETRQFISSNKGYFSSGILKRGLTTKMDASSAPMWEIVFIDYKNKEQYKYRFVDHMLIGRTPPESSEEVKMVLSSDMMVSGTHAIIYIREGNFIIEDRGSKNKTYVNGNIITQPCILEQGSVLKIGASKFQVALGRS